MQSLFSWLQQQLTPRRQAVVLLLVGVIVPFVIFGDLAEDVWEEQGFFFDVPILLAIHRTARPQLDVFVSYLTNLGVFWGVVPASIVTILLLIFRRRWRALEFFLFTLVGSGILNRSTKLLLHRVRPHLWTSPAPELDYGFPSGHAMASMTFVVALVILSWNSRWRWFVVIVGTMFVLVIGWTRLYLGVHYPSDVLAGWMVSLGWTVGVSLLINPHTVSRKISR
ncbi:phosphatase PAP2 family protein [Nostoc sp. MS1]|uniref:phosphatase PAP2 family protein n=1 Tax=Nostoc sp. MS1 TaxID=2764711 RepID=UPI001CC5CC7C|nr:phosphatase PAP2 family protein [Nostoc sp. MS1]BCL37679.1 phosphatidylglycerophosphatase B [Nostoc sp. MS1]